MFHAQYARLHAALQCRSECEAQTRIHGGGFAQVPCVAVVENMSYFDGHDGTRYRPFGAGSGDRIVADFGLPHLVRFPIVADLSAAGDGAADA